MLSTKFSWRASCKGWSLGGFEGELRKRGKWKEKRGEVGLGRKRRDLLRGFREKEDFEEDG